MRYYSIPLLPFPVLLAAAALAQGPVPGSEVRADRRDEPLRSIDLAATFDRDALEAAARASFARADRDGDGEVTIGEAEHVARVHRGAEVAARFAQLDTDDDGSISAAEFAAWERRAERAPPPPFEDSGAGLRAPGPMSLAGLTAMGSGSPYREGLSGPLGAETVAAADTDRNGALTLAEWLAFEGDRFDNADSDGDGVISPDEWPVRGTFVPRPADGARSGEQGPPVHLRVRKDR